MAPDPNLIITHNGYVTRAPDDVKADYAVLFKTIDETRKEIHARIAEMQKEMNELETALRVFSNIRYSKDRKFDSKET